MRAVGIVAEYNPFHNGHLLHLNEVKKRNPEAVVVLVLSGNFTQRGDVSILDKWEKTQIALAHGVDLVVELPFPFATQSADMFAKGAITILEHLQVEKIIFGSETNDIEILERMASIQEQDSFQEKVHQYLKDGINYPTALSKALQDQLSFTLDQPNDLLGISYLKAIHALSSQMSAQTIPRIGAYHEEQIQDSIASATAIRKAILEGENVSTVVPQIVGSYLGNRRRSMEDLFPFLRYKILTETDLSIYQDVDEGLEHRLKKVMVRATNYQEFVQTVKTKRYTYNKIGRMCCHILCNFTKEKANQWQEVEYIRLLGFSPNGQKYLQEVKKNLSVPLIAKFKKNQSTMLDYECCISAVYANLLPKPNEFIQRETSQAPIQL